MKRFIPIVILLIACLIAFPQTEGRAADKIVLKLGYSSPTANPWHTCAEKFAKYVNEKTGDKVAVDLFPAEVLGSDKQMAESIKMGTLDMHIAPQGVVAFYEPKMAALELPFLFDSPEKVAALLDGPMGDELAADLPAKGIRVLAYWENGLRHTTNSKKPIEQPEDLKGMKIRTPENKMTISIFKALGANPAPLTYSELYLALSQGVFDGQENPITNIHASKFYEVQKFISLTYHKYEGKPFTVSEKVWKTLAPDIQKAIRDGAKIYAVENRAMFKESEIRLLEDLKVRGMKVSTPNLQPFREATKPVYAEWEQVLGKDFIAKVVSAAK
jgi:tripartite ATP-independent transporter DctP family solute receptor